MNEQRQIRAPELTKFEIRKQAHKLTQKYARTASRGEALNHISFEKVYDEIIYPEYGIEIEEGVDLGVDAKGEKILGAYDAISNVAYIDISLSKESQDPRRAFTLWHEVGGHGVLQGAWLRKEIDRIGHGHRLISTAASLSLNVERVLERQANIFAANAGVPIWLLEYQIKRVMGWSKPIRYVGPRRYSLEVNGRCYSYDITSYKDLTRLVASFVQPSFGGMSKESIGYQIAETVIVIDVTNQSNFILNRIQRPCSETQLSHQCGVFPELAQY